MSADRADDFGTQAIAPVVFRFPNAWLSWQAVVGDLAARGQPDARLRFETSGADDLPKWTAELHWGANQERAEGCDSLPAGLRALWDEVIQRHALYPGDQAKRGPALYEPNEALDGATLAAVTRLLNVARAAYGADWSLLFVYQPVLKADQRVHVRLVARRGEVNVSAGGPTLLEGARTLMRTAMPYLPRHRRRE